MWLRLFLFIILATNVSPLTGRAQIAILDCNDLSQSLPVGSVQLAVGKKQTMVKQ
jgi:hypothetical protein